MVHTLKKIERDENGLIIGKEYHFTEDGRVDWRKMIPNEFLYPNAARTQETDVTKCKDSELIINLAGIVYLANLRGYTAVSYSSPHLQEGLVSTKCEINWRPNYETENERVSFESLAGAHAGNTNGFGQNYLVEMAENRAFCRNVRRFLQINIVSQEELGETPKTKAKTTEQDPNSPNGILESSMKTKGISFETVKKALIDENVEGAADFETVWDIPKAKCAKLIERIKNYKKKT